MEPDEPCTSLTTTESFTPSPAPLSAAAYRDKLLSGTLSDDEGVSDDNALVVISVGRLKELLSGNSCDVCGEQAQSDIKKKYFDWGDSEMQHL